MKRLLVLAVAVALLITSSPYLTVKASAKYFVDTYQGMLDPEFFDAFNYVSDNEWMNGTDATHFSPYVAITRGMFVMGDL